MILRYLAILLLMVTTSPGQGRHVFVLAPAQSTFTFSGQVAFPPLPSLPINGQPSNQFTAEGTADLDLTVVGGVATVGQLVPGGSARTVPDLMATVPNILPFLPPVATINITGLTLDFVSTDAFGAPAPFPIGQGTFSTFVVGRVLTGAASVTALGSTQSLSLAGQQSPPQAVTGALTSTPVGFVINTPVSVAFTFMDPTTGATGSLAFTGSLIADYQPLNASVVSVSVATGGVQELVLSTGGSFGGDLYALVASASGTSPGTALGVGIVLPLNMDALFLYALQFPNQPPFVNNINNLDLQGRGLVSITVPPLPPSTAGASFDLAYATLDGLGIPGMVSNPFSLTLVP